MFWVLFAVSMVRTLVYTMWASAEVQPWNEPKENEMAESENLKPNTDDCIVKEI